MSLSRIADPDTPLEDSISFKAVYAAQKKKYKPVALKTRPVKAPLPAGYRIEWGGQFENQQRAAARLMLVVPVALLGTLGVMLGLGYSINVLTMFGMVLAIGILVDDAIVVVENVERVIA